jgi:galactonate dehydratase
VKIDSVETFIAHNWMFVRLRTDSGLSGIGESTFFGFPEAAAAVVQRFSPKLRGQDPMRAEFIFLDLYRSVSMRGMAIGGALSAIDQALWDIKGKHFQAPVWQLLGGRVRDRVRAMLVIDYGTIEQVVAQCRDAVGRGYTALKILLFQDEHHGMRHGGRLQDLVARTAAIREAVGWDFDLGIELHRNMVPGESIALIRELEQFRPMFVEDPIVPDSVLSFGEVSTKSRVPMAAGERNTTIWEFREYVEHGGLHHVRPDVGIAGGITHVKKICALAEAHHQGVIPHAVPSGPVATAAQVQLGACVPNWEVQEHREQDKAPWSRVVGAVIPVRNGFFDIPEAPGLGIALDDVGLATVPVLHRESKTARREDGGIAFR